MDPYLRVETLAGQTLAVDDDSGGNLNARIVFKAPSSAKYRIVATSFAPGMTGDFTLAFPNLLRRRYRINGGPDKRDRLSYVRGDCACVA